MSEAQADGDNEQWVPNEKYAVACSYDDPDEGATTKKVILKRMQAFGLTLEEAQFSYKLAKDADLI